MNVKELKALIADLPDDTLIVSEDGDHALYAVSADVIDAHKEAGRYFMYWGEKLTPTTSGKTKKLKVVLIS